MSTSTTILECLTPSFSNSEGDHRNALRDHVLVVHPDFSYDDCSFVKIASNVREQGGVGVITFLISAYWQERDFPAETIKDPKDLTLPMDTLVVNAFR